MLWAGPGESHLPRGTNVAPSLWAPGLPWGSQLHGMSCLLLLSHWVSATDAQVPEDNTHTHEHTHELIYTVCLSMQFPPVLPKLKAAIAYIGVYGFELRN